MRWLIRETAQCKIVQIVNSSHLAINLMRACSFTDRLTKHWVVFTKQRRGKIADIVDRARRFVSWSLSRFDVHPIAFSAIFGASFAWVSLMVSLGLWFVFSPFRH
jgi:hypothetical protein